MVQAVQPNLYAATGYKPSNSILQNKEGGATSNMHQCCVSLRSSYATHSAKESGLASHAAHSHQRAGTTVDPHHYVAQTPKTFMACLACLDESWREFVQQTLW